MIKITKKQLRRLIAEAKFTPKRPLDRDAMQIALGIHSSQMERTDPRDHPFYEEGKKELFNLIETNADPKWGDVNPGEHIDNIVSSGVDFVGSVYAWETSPDGKVDDPITEAHVQLMLEDLLDAGYVSVSVGDLVLPTPEGHSWFWTI